MVNENGRLYVEVLLPKATLQSTSSQFPSFELKYSRGFKDVNPQANT